MKSDAEPRLTIIAPGLLGPLRGWQPGTNELPELTALRHLLGDARETEGPRSYAAAVSRAFSLSDAGGEGATAAFDLLGHPPDGPGLRAAPVHLRVETDFLLLYDDYLLELEQAEAEALAATFNETYADTGLRLHAPSPADWLLTGLEHAPAGLTPLREVRGRNIGVFMPEGRSGAPLRTLMNEVQMLFHNHPVNHDRAAREQPTVSGIWLWGEGKAPRQVRRASVWADDPWLRGLARLAGAFAAPCPQAWPAADDSARYVPDVLVVDDADAPGIYGEPCGWVTALEGLERSWFEPIRHSLRDGALRSIDLMTCDGRRFHVRRRRWPRLLGPPSLTAFVRSES